MPIHISDLQLAARGWPQTADHAEYVWRIEINPGDGKIGLEAFRLFLDLYDAVPFQLRHAVTARIRNLLQGDPGALRRSGRGGQQWSQRIVKNIVAEND